MSLIKTPFSLSRELKRQIADAYELAIGEVGREELEYVRKRLPKMVKTLKREPGSWLWRMAHVTEALVSLSQKKKLSKKSNREVIAALFYLCNPFDVIPDHDPKMGFVDDAFILTLCLKRLKATDPDFFAALEELLRIYLE